MVQEAAGSCSLAPVLLSWETQQGLIASAAPTQWTPGTWARLTCGRSTHSPALPHGCTPAGHKAAPGPCALGLFTPHQGCEWISSITSRGQEEMRHPAGVLLPGWVQRAAHRAVATGITGNGPHALGLLRLQQEELLGYCLCLTASERTD